MRRDFWKGLEADHLGELDPRSVYLGPGHVLVLKRRGYLPLAVTADNAGEAADLVNALLLRRIGGAAARHFTRLRGDACRL